MRGVLIRNICKNFGSAEILKNIELTIGNGEFMSLVGPSGCGKSTLLRIIAGLENQTSGNVCIGDKCVDDKRPKDRHVAMVFQSYALYPHMTVFNNIALPLQMRRLKKYQRLPLIGRCFPGVGQILNSIDKDVIETAQMLGIEHLLTRKPKQLSGGQAQRVALGRAMVRRPRVFLMDEPLSNLDAKLRVQMRMEIVQLHQRLGVTFIYVTHDQAEAMTMSDRVAVMMDGRILQIASPDEIYNEPVDLRVAEFIGSPRINTLFSQVSTMGGLEIFNHFIPINTGLPTGTKVIVAARPEAVNLTLDLQKEGIPGIVVFRENLGSEVLVNVGVDGSEQKVTVRLDPLSGCDVLIGSRVRLKLPLRRLIVFNEEGERIHAQPLSFSREYGAVCG